MYLFVSSLKDAPGGNAVDRRWAGKLVELNGIEPDVNSPNQRRYAES